MYVCIQVSEEDQILRGVQMSMVGSLEVASLAVDTHREHEGDEEPGAISTRRVRLRVGFAQEFPPERGQVPADGWINQHRAPSRGPSHVPLALADVEEIEAPSSVEDEILDAIDSRRSGRPPAWHEPYALNGDELLASPSYRKEERAPQNPNDTEDTDQVTSTAPLPVAPPRSRRPVVVSPAVMLAWTDDD